MKRTLPHCFPTEISEDERRAGFRHMVLALEDFIGPFGDHLEVVGRKLSDADLLIKMNSGGIFYRHIRFGYTTWVEHFSSVYHRLRSGGWRTWFSAFWLRRAEWQHIPHALYESPKDDCSRSVAWNRIVGVSFHEYEP